MNYLELSPRHHELLRCPPFPMNAHLSTRSLYLVKLNPLIKLFIIIFQVAVAITMNRCISLLILVVLSAVHTNCHNVNSQKLRLIYSWKSLDFAYPNDAIRQQAITNGLYKPGAPVPIDVDISRGK